MNTFDYDLAILEVNGGRPGLPDLIVGLFVANFCLWPVPGPVHSSLSATQQAGLESVPEGSGAGIGSSPEVEHRCEFLG